MKISTKGRYGLRAVLDLAVHSDGSPILLKDIANRQNISRRYLERLFASLKSSGILRSIRGAQGGYVLGKTTEQISLGEILESLEGPLVPVDCVSDNGICHGAEMCVTRDIWCEIAKQTWKYLDNIKLQDLVDDYHRKNTMRIADYQI